MKLAILNCCDGLGLAHSLAEGEDLYLPQMIVMREELPVAVAPRFLQYFLEEFTQYNSLYASVREARRRLQILEKEFPCASNLPVICQNPAVKPLRWNDLVIPPCPYRGLSAFQEEDAELFFGRESFTNHLVKVVEDKKLVAVIGASGSGKSSVVLAGLIPRLRPKENWLIASLRPGATPFENLAKALLLPEQLATELQEGIRSLPDVIKSIGESRTVLLVVDQFEEIYSYPNQKFLDCLLDAVRDVSAFRLVITLRADFLGQAIEYNPLREQLQRWKSEFIGAMERQQLQAVIEAPAKKRGVYLEAGLTEQILNDVGNEPGYLPLLEFALTEMWNKQENGWLTRKVYDDIGGVENALRRHAERVYDELEKADRERVKRIFLQLVSPGEGTEYIRRMATRAEVGEANWDLVIRLATARLVVSNRNETTEIETVEIVHEALIKAWPDLQKWIEEDDVFLRWKKRLQAALGEWERNENKEGYLLQVAPLGEAEGYLLQRLGDISPAERVFIQLGLGLRDRNRRRTILSLTSGLVIALGLTGLAGWLWQQAEIGRINAQFVADSLSIEALLNSNLDIEALAKAVGIGRQLQKSDVVKPDVKMRAIAAIRQVVYGVREVNRQKGQSKFVTFSPDGKFLVFCEDKTIKIWEIATGKVQKIEGHNSDIRSISFSADSKTIASADSDKTIKLWNLDGKELQTFKGHSADINSISFSPDGKTIASASSDKTIKLWNLDGKELQTFKGHKSRIWKVIFSPDGKTIVSASGEVAPSAKDAILGNVLDPSQREERFDLDIISGDNKDYTSGDNTIKIWSLEGKELRTFKGHSKRVSSISFSPDGKIIASASDDGTIKLWSLEGKELRTFKGHSKRVRSISFSPDGKIIASASDDDTIKFWSLDGKELQSLKGHNFGVTNISFSPFSQAYPHGISKIIASAGADDTIRIWSFTPRTLKIFKKHFGSVSSVIFSPNGKIIASASDDRTIKLWSPDGEEIKNLTIPHFWLLGEDWAGVNSISFSPDSKTIISGSTDGIKLWNFELQDIKTFKSTRRSVSGTVSFSSDGKTIAFDGKNNTVNIWNTEGQELRALKGHKDNVRSVSFSPNGSIIASASNDDTIKLWSLDGREIQTLKGHKDDVNNVIFSPDGSIIASASSDATIKLWSLDGRELRTFKGHNNSVYGISFSPDGKVIASAGGDRTIKLWSLEGQELQTLRGHTDIVTSINFSPDGKTIASSSVDGTVILWNFDLDNLLIRACDWLRSYLNNNSSVISEDRYVCDGIEPAPSSLFLQEGRDLAKSEDIMGAVAYFKKALELDNNLNIDPEKEARKIAALSLIEQGKYLATKVNIAESIKKFTAAKDLDNSLNIYPQKEAHKIAASVLVDKAEALAVQKDLLDESISIYRQAKELDETIKISTNWLLSLCLVGSLEGRAASFVVACEELVKVEPEKGQFLFLRGIARAMTNNIKGAIEDFEASIKWIDSDVARSLYTQESLDKLRQQHIQWIDALRAGKNPIKPQELESKIKLIPR